VSHGQVENDFIKWGWGQSPYQPSRLAS